MWPVNMNKQMKKQEIAVKVKEIKQRQHNWMKERAASKHDEGTPSKSFGAHSATTSTSSSARNAIATTSNSATNSNNSRSSQGLPEDILASKKSKAKFQNWLKARDGKSGADGDRIIRHNNRSYDSSNYSNAVNGEEAGYCNHGDANVLKISPGYTTPDSNWNSDDETGEITAAQLMSPEDFDAVADDIIARVKGDMTTKNGVKASKMEGNGAKLTSHICPNCDHLMVPPQHNPMLIIPCGHTLCKPCSRKSKYCCVCGCPVQSTTDNVMLQQIITDYQSQDRARKEEKQRNRKIYKEEYQNLITRQEILQEESASISKTISKLTAKMTKEKQQIDSISKEEENIQSRIRTLQQQCQALGEHRREYERNYDELENHSESEKKRLVLVKNSLKSVQEQIEKVKLLAES